MKLTPSQLRRIIREEASKITNEAFFSPSAEAEPGRDALAHAVEVLFEVKDTLDAVQAELSESQQMGKPSGEVAAMSKKLMRAVSAISRAYDSQDAAIGEVWEYLDR